MTTWTEGELCRVAKTDDLHVSPFREDGVTHGTPTWIWSVVVGDAPFVRAYNGQSSRWYRTAVQQKAGRITAAGLTQEVTFEPMEDSVNDRIDDAYRTKCGSSPYLGHRIGPRAPAATVKITPDRRVSSPFGFLGRAALCCLLLAAPFAARARPVALERDAELLMPVEGVVLSGVADTWGAARSEGRTREGVDIFVPEGTPVYSATAGYAEYVGPYGVGGDTVTVVGAGGVRYYYAHLSGYAEGLEQGQAVTTETLLGYVGSTGNAQTTPPHLHFGVYTGGWNAENPYPLLVDRAW